MTTSDHFEREALRCQRELEYFDASGLQLFQLTDQGEVEITQQYRNDLIAARDDCQRVAEMWGEDA